MISKLGIQSGPSGIAQTLVAMQGLIVDSDSHREVKDTAVAIIKDIQPNEHKEQVDAIAAWVRGHMKYVRDINGVEEVQAPHILLAKIAQQGWAYGDCDDYATLIATLLRAVGFRTRLEAVAVEADQYNHARMSVYFDGNWLAIEGTKDWPVGSRYASNLDVMFVEPQG